MKVKDASASVPATVYRNDWIKWLDQGNKRKEGPSRCDLLYCKESV